MGHVPPHYFAWGGQCPHKMLVTNKVIHCNAHTLLSVRSIMSSMYMALCGVGTRETLGQLNLHCAHFMHVHAHGCPHNPGWALPPMLIKTADLKH